MDDKKFRDDLAALKEQEKAVRKSVHPHGEPNADETSAPSPALRYTWLGLEFAAIFFGFVWGGFKLDQIWGTKPWLVLVGIAAGFSIALYRLIFVARRLSE